MYKNRIIFSTGLYSLKSLFIFTISHPWLTKALITDYFIHPSLNFIYATSFKEPCYAQQATIGIFR